MMNHEQVSELLGAYALDAVEADEAEAVAAHLDTCPRCRDELRSHLEVVGVLAYAGQEAPEGLWDRVVARINDPDDTLDQPAGLRPETPPLSLRLLSDAGGPAGPPGRTARPTRRVSLLTRATPVMSLLAAAAVVVIALLGVEVTRLQNRTDHLSGEVSAMSGQPDMATVRRALATPGARPVSLRPVSGGAPALDAVILPSGQGYLYDARLTPLSPAQTYQLWGVVGTDKISYGLLGSTPATVMSFRASSGVQALAVTAEVAGGVVTSSQRPVAVGMLS